MVTLVGMEPLKQLRLDARSREILDERRGSLIVAARRSGATWREIAAAVNLTELAVRQAAMRANDGELPRPS